MSGKLHGIFTPNLVPLSDDGSINERELRRYIDWLIASGVHGLYPNGSTGEFTRFTADERKQIVRIVCEQAAGRVPVLAGAAEANVRETLQACETYAGYGARAVAIVSPFYYKLSPESVYAYYREIALNSPIDVTLYNIPMFASPIDVPTIRRLAEFPRIFGIKDSSGDMAFMMRMIAAVRPIRPDFTFLTGWEAVLVPMLLIGCDGGTNAISGIVPELTRKIYDLTRAGRLDEAMRIQYRMLELFDAMLYSADFPEGFRAAVDLRGFRLAPAASPRARSRRSTLPPCKACCAASSPSLAWSIRPRQVVRREAATWTRIESNRSPPWSCSNCGSGAPFEGTARNELQSLHGERTPMPQAFPRKAFVICGNLPAARGSGRQPARRCLPSCVFLVFTLLWGLSSAACGADLPPSRGLAEVDHARVELRGGFWGPRLKSCREVTVPHALDCLERDGHVTNFDKAAGRFPGPLRGHHAFDSDLHKALEGDADSLQHYDDAKLRQRVEQIVDRILAAQQKDGFLISYFIVQGLDKKWGDLRLEHQMYNAGHFFEMAVEHHRLTGDPKVLEAAKRFADHIDGVLGRASAMTWTGTRRLSWLWSSFFVPAASGATWNWPSSSSTNAVMPTARSENRLIRGPSSSRPIRWNR